MKAKDFEVFDIPMVVKDGHQEVVIVNKLYDLPLTCKRCELKEEQRLYEEYAK